MNRVLTVEAMQACADRGHRWRRVPTWNGLGFTECATCGETRPTLRGPVGDLQADLRDAAKAAPVDTDVVGGVVVMDLADVEFFPFIEIDGSSANEDLHIACEAPAPASNEVAKADMAPARRSPRSPRRNVARNLEVVRLAAAGVSRAEIARQMGVSWARVQQILRSEAAASAAAAPSAPSPTFNHVPNDRDRSICELRAAGVSGVEVAARFGIDPSRVSQITKKYQAARPAAAEGGA